MSRSREEIEYIVNDLGYDLLDEYLDVNSVRRVIIKNSDGYHSNISLKILVKNHGETNFISIYNTYTLYNISIWLKLNKKTFELNKINEYVRSDKNLSFNCFVCGHIFYTCWDKILYNRGCAVCAGKQVPYEKSLNYVRPDLVRDWVKSENNLNPIDVTEFSGERVYWCCSSCNHNWWASIDSRTKNNTGCPSCCGKVVSDKNRLSLNNPELIPEWHSTKNGDLTPDDVSYGSNRKVWWLCKDCGREWENIIKSRTTSNTGCPHCSGHLLSDKNCLAFLYPVLCNEEWDCDKNGDLIPENFKYGSHQKIWWKCFDCEHSWSSAIKSRTIGGQGCPACSESKGEKFIRKFFGYTNINFIPQFKIKECRNIKELPFDFYLPDYNLLIEYDGILHFIDKFNNPKEFKKIQMRDKIKTQFCIDNNIPLLRIHYKDFKNIESILTQYLNSN